MKTEIHEFFKELVAEARDLPKNRSKLAGCAIPENWFKGKNQLYGHLTEEYIDNLDIDSCKLYLINFIAMSYKQR